MQQVPHVIYETAPSLKGLGLVILSSSMTVVGKVTGSDLAILLSIIVSCLAAVDYSIKIQWKLHERKKARQEKTNRKKDESTKGGSAKAHHDKEREE